MKKFNGKKSDELPNVIYVRDPFWDDLNRTANTVLKIMLAPVILLFVVMFFQQLWRIIQEYWCGLIFAVPFLGVFYLISKSREEEKKLGKMGKRTPPINVKHEMSYEKEKRACRPLNE